MGGGVNYSRQASLSQFFLLISDHFLSPVTDNLLSQIGGREKTSTKECVASKCQSWVCLQITQLQCSMGCHGHHAILCSQTGLFSEALSFWQLVVPLNNFAFMSNCPWVPGKSNKPLPLPRCMWGGGQIVIHDFTSFF